MFDLKKYRQSLNTKWLGHEFEYFEELPSTNSYLKELDTEKVSHGQLCLADYQINGRGQYNRKWEAETGKNLTMTGVFRPTSAGRLHILTLACARAIVAEIEATLGCRASIKWPNDVIVKQKKVAGILTETVFNGQKLDRLLVGIGLNVNQEHFSAALRPHATSLRKIVGRPIGREKFLCRLLSRLEFQYTRWHKQDDELLKDINKKIIGYGNWSKLQVNGAPRPGKFKLLGINQKGQFTAVNKKGDLETFSYEQIRLIPD